MGTEGPNGDASILAFRVINIDVCICIDYFRGGGMEARILKSCRDSRFPRIKG